jgi:phosphonate transport system substrate-binding protein
MKFINYLSLPTKQFKALLISFILGASTCSYSQTANKELIVGVVPNVSARIIAKNYQNFSRYLEGGLGNPVTIATAKDFPDFHKQTMENNFQLIVTTPNLGRVAFVDGGWEELYIFEPSIPGLLVGLADTNNDLSKLKGKKLAVANPQSLVALAGVDWLNKQGYVLGIDYEIMRIANDDSLGIALTSGEAPFALMSMGEFRAKDEQLRKSLKIVNEFIKLPNFLIMASPKMSEEDRKKIKSLLKQLPATELGKLFFADSGFTNIVTPTNEQNKFLDQFVNATRAGLIPKK